MQKKYLFCDITCSLFNNGSCLRRKGEECRKTTILSKFWKYFAVVCGQVWTPCSDNSVKLFSLCIMTCFQQILHVTNCDVEVKKYSMINHFKERRWNEIKEEKWRSKYQIFGCCCLLPLICSDALTSFPRLADLYHFTSYGTADKNV